MTIATNTAGAGANPSPHAASAAMAPGAGPPAGTMSGDMSIGITGNTTGAGGPPSTPPGSPFRLALPERQPLLSKTGWTLLVALVLAVGIGVPLMSLVVPETSSFHL